MDMEIPPLKIKILPESNPLNSRIVVRGLAVWDICGVSVLLARKIRSPVLAHGHMSHRVV